MTTDQQLKLQAFFDGELPEAEAREIAAWIARDPEAAQLQAELKNTRQALKGFEAGTVLPESRDFFWSKIKREIAPTVPVAPPEPRVSVFSLLRRLFAPVGIIAGLALVAFIATRSPTISTAAAAEADTQTELADAGAVTYHNYETSTTLVWFSYPSDDSADNATTIQ